MYQSTLYHPVMFTTRIASLTLTLRLNGGFNALGSGMTTVELEIMYSSKYVNFITQNSIVNNIDKITTQIYSKCVPISRSKTERSCCKSQGKCVTEKMGGMHKTD